jgi:predicted PurR-regulated permease PerM
MELHPPVVRETAPARQPGWRSVDILRAAALVMGLYLVLRLVWLVHDLLFIAFLGLLFGLAVGSGTDFLQRRLRVPRGLGAVLIVFSFVGLLVGLGAWSAPILRAQFGELQKTLPQAIDRAEGWLDSHRDGFLGQIVSGPARQAEAAAAQPAPTPAPAAPGGTPKPEGPESGGGSLSEIPGSLSGQLGAVSRYLFSFLSSTVAVLGGLVLILFLSIYIGSDPDSYLKGALHLVPRPARPRAREVLAAISVTLRRWLLAQLVAMAVIGVVTTIVLSLLGVKAAISLGLIAGLLEFIPIAGPFLSAVPAIAMGFLDSPQTALFVALAWVVIQQLENHVLIPILMRQGVDLPPVVTLLGLALMGIVFGFLGMLVAVPVLAAVMVAIKLLYVEDVVGDEVKATG